MAYIILPSRRTRQPQGPVRVAPQWAHRVKLLSIGGQLQNFAPNGGMPTVSGSPATIASTYGRLTRFVPDTTDHFNYSLTPILNAVSVFSIAHIPSGVTGGVIAATCTSANDSKNNPYFFAYIDSTNGLYSVRAGEDNNQVYKPNVSTGVVAGGRYTLAATWADGNLATVPTFYVNGSSYGATALATGTGSVAGGNGACYIGARDGSAGLYSGIELELMAIFDSQLTADEYLRLYPDPYGELLAPDPRRLYFGASGGGATTTTIEPSKGSLAVAGYAPGIAQPRVVAPSKGAATLTGYAPGIEQDRAVAPAKSALTITGYAPTLTQPRTIAAVKGALSLAGYAPGISQSASGTIAPSAGALLLTGYAPGLEQDRNVAPSVGHLTLTGGQPGIVQNVTTFIAPSKGALALLGYTPDVTTTANQAIAPTQGALLLGGYAPVLAQTGAQIIGPIKGALTLAGYAPTVQVIGTGVTLVEPTVGALTIAGYAPLVRVAVTPPRGGGYSFGTMGGAERRPPQDNARRPS